MPTPIISLLRISLLTSWPVLIVQCGGSSSSSSTPTITAQVGGRHSGNSPAPQSSTWDTFDHTGAYKPPTSFESVDLLDFSIADYESGGGKDDLNPPGFMIPVDGRSHVFPACSKPVAAPSIASITPQLDGNLGEWSDLNPVSIDRSGDAPGDHSGLDARGLYVSQDSNYLYLGIKTAAAWSSSLKGQVVIEINNLSFTSNGESFSNVLSYYTDAIRNWHFPSGAFTTLSEDFITSAAGSDGIEVRLTKDQALANLGSRYAVTITLWMPDVGTDSMGSYYEGVSKDYACLVPMPESGWKLLVMQRQEAISSSTAEAHYRSMIAASAAAEHGLKVGHSGVDTIPYTLLSKMNAAGRYQSQQGIFVLTMENFTNPAFESFFTNAHEYAHGINAFDWELEDTWMREGHSETVAWSAARSYFGDFSPYRAFQQAWSNQETAEEKNGFFDLREWNSVGLITEYYAKSSILMRLIEDQWSKDSFQDFLTSANSLSSDSFFESLAKNPPFDDPTTAPKSPWPGWFTSTGYDQLLIDPYHLLTDNDSDGVRDHQETTLGTAADNWDSDGDLASDGIESLIEGQDHDKADNNRLALDGFLDDWPTFLPGALTADPVDVKKVCSSSAEIKHWGIAYDGNLLGVGVRFGNGAPAKELRLDLFLHKNRGLDSGSTSVLAHAIGRDQTAVFQDGELTGQTPIINSANKDTIEIYAHRQLLNWNQFPKDTYASLCVSQDIQGTYQNCDCTEIRPISFYFAK